MTSASINMDKTIQKSLNNLVSYLSNVLKTEQQKITKLKDKKKKQDAEILNKQQLESLKFLQTVAKNPKQYLCTKRDWIYNEDTDGKTIYSKLKSLTYNNLPEISSNALKIISKIYSEHHNNPFETKSKQWIVHSHENISDDMRNFLAINKKLALLNGSLFLRKMQESLNIGDFMPNNMFLVRQRTER